MAIFRETTKINDDICKEVIRNYLQFDKKTLEFSFNEESLIRNGWIYAAVDGSFLEEDEVSRIISLSKKSQFFCLNLDRLFNISPYEIIVYKFDNNLEDWKTILSPDEEYTLWSSLLFNMDNLFIIKPWSSGYNLLFAGEENIVRNICTDNYWLFNKKYPIYPL